MLARWLAHPILPRPTGRNKRNKYKQWAVPFFERWDSVLGLPAQCSAQEAVPQELDRRLSPKQCEDTSTSITRDGPTAAIVDQACPHRSAAHFSSVALGELRNSSITRWDTSTENDKAISGTPRVLDDVFTSTGTPVRAGNTLSTL
jgi:hypothetical protein